MGNETAHGRQAAPPACVAPGGSWDTRSCHGSSARPPPAAASSARPAPAVLRGGADIYPGHALCLWESCFSSPSERHLAWGWGQQDLPGPPARQVLPGPPQGSQSRGGDMEQSKRSGHQLLAGVRSQEPRLTHSFATPMLPREDSGPSCSC